MILRSCMVSTRSRRAPAAGQLWERWCQHPRPPGALGERCQSEGCDTIGTSATTSACQSVQARRRHERSPEHPCAFACCPRPHRGNHARGCIARWRRRISAFCWSSHRSCACSWIMRPPATHLSVSRVIRGRRAMAPCAVGVWLLDVLCAGRRLFQQLARIAEQSCASAATFVQASAGHTPASSVKLHFTDPPQFRGNISYLLASCRATDSTS